MSRKTGSSRI